MFWFKKKSKKGLKFLEGATDIHCHLLAGVDDGFETLSDSYELLAQQQNAGLKRVYLTPHSMGLEGAVVDRETRLATKSLQNPASMHQSLWGVIPTPISKRGLKNTGNIIQGAWN